MYNGLPRKTEDEVLNKGQTHIFNANFTAAAEPFSIRFACVFCSLGRLFFWVHGFTVNFKMKLKLCKILKEISK